MILYTGSEPLVVLLAALLCDALLAGLPGIRDTVGLAAAAVARFASWFDRRLNRPHRSRPSRTIRGALVSVIFAVLGAGFGILAARAVRAIPEGWLIESLFVLFLLIQRRTFDDVGAVGRALRIGGVDKARKVLSSLVSYDTDALDEHGISRGAAESCAQDICDGIVAPIFWYLIFGLPGLFAYRGINILARTIGLPSPRLADFGRTAAITNRVLVYVPSAIGGVLIALASLFVPTANPARAFKTMMTTSRPVGGGGWGWTQGALAGALGLALGGPVRYESEAVSFPWIGDGRARAVVKDTARARFVFAVTGLLAAILVALLHLGK